MPYIYFFIHFSIYSNDSQIILSNLSFLQGKRIDKVLENTIYSFIDYFMKLNGFHLYAINRYHFRCLQDRKLK